MCQAKIECDRVIEMQLKELLKEMKKKWCIFSVKCLQSFTGEEGGFIILYKDLCDVDATCNPKIETLSTSAVWFLRSDHVAIFLIEIMREFGTYLSF